MHSSFAAGRAAGSGLRAIRVLSLAALLAMPGSVMAQRADPAVINRIKEEGWQRSEVMDISSWLIDVYGPRLTNSPIMRMAADWTLKKFTDMGLANPHFEYFNFGRGWMNEKNYMQVVSPVPYPLLGGPGAWTVGTNGLVRGEVVILNPLPSTEAQFDSLRGTLRNKIILTANPVNVNPMFAAPATRFTIPGLDSLVANQPGLAIVPDGRQGGGRAGGRGGAGAAGAAGGRAGAAGGAAGAAGGRGAGGPPATPPAGQPPAGQQPAAQPGRGGGRGGGGGDAAARTRFFVQEGVLALLSPATSQTNNGSFGNGPQGNRQPNNDPALPQLGVAAEHYNRLYRQVQRGVNVVVELDVQNRFTGEDLSSMNIVAEIPGTDKKDEIVMIGGHFDSWHQGTGATDNGCSCAVMIEALRILKAANAPLRRTVRIGLWTGEEQGLIGSREYVAAHFAGRGPAPAPAAGAAGAAGGAGRGGGRGGGGPVVPKPDHEKFSVYFNQDNGCGAIRGVYTQGNAAAVPVFREWFKLVDSDSISVRHITQANTGGTDHQSFDAVGLPGFQFIQDRMDYNTRTHHFSQDLYERLVPRDMMHNATTIAVLIYMAANSNERFPREAMPAPPGEQ